MSVFDIRRKGIEWDEEEDFSDAVWRHGLGQREASYYYKRALPLTLLAGSSLAEVDFESEVVIHCLFDGNTAPFAETHDWGALLKRCPRVKTLTVVYIDFGFVGDIPKDAGAMPYGTLMRPTEEGRVGDRVAMSARFLGTYSEFLAHCRELPGLVVPHVALWADAPLYGFNDADLAVRLEAYKLVCAAGVPSVFTQWGEIHEPRTPPIALRVDESANLSMAILAIGLSAKMKVGWTWNRFVVPLDRGERGILAAHALLGIIKPGKGSKSKDVASGTVAKALPNSREAHAAQVKKALKLREVPVVKFKPPKTMTQQAEMQLHQKQWDAFRRRLKEQGRESDPKLLTPEERDRQAMEFYQFCGMGG